MPFGLAPFKLLAEPCTVTIPTLHTNGYLNFDFPYGGHRLKQVTPTCAERELLQLYHRSKPSLLQCP